MSLIRRVFDFKGGPLLAGFFVILIIAESRRPLRKRTASRIKRTIVNSVASLPAFSLLRLMFLPIMVKLAQRNQQRQKGLKFLYHAPPLVKDAVTYLLLDYSNYWWHILLHRLPLLWRFHVVHHSDPDLDVATALRFHFGEIIGSVFYRGAFVVLTGASPKNVLYYEIAFEGATQFHHSNQKLPIIVEKALSAVFVTPRMHGIHHSVNRQETDSNYAVILSVWDRLNNTIRLNVPQDKVIIGLPMYDNAADLTIGKLLALPFTKMFSWPLTKKHPFTFEDYKKRNILAE